MLVVGILFTGFYLFVNNKENSVTIGIARWVSDAEYDQNIEGFKESLAEAGFIEGKNVEYIV